MDLVHDDDIFSLGLGLSWMHGEYTKYPSKKLYIYRSFNISIVILTLFSILLNFERISKDEYIKEIDNVFTVLHCLLKYCFYVCYKTEIIKILKWSLEFRNYQECDRRNYMECKKLYERFDVIQKCYSVIALIALLMFTLKPVVTENNKFIFDCWCIWDSIVLDTIALFFQYYYLVLVVPVVVGYDIIYFCCCAHLTIQLRILKFKLESLKSDSKTNEVYECVQHHQLLLLVFSSMKNIYFWMLLFHYMSTLVTCCIQLYAISISSADAAKLAEAAIYILVMLVQFACYSFPAEQMVFELRRVAVAIYASTWYETPVPVMKTLLLMMMRSQEQEYLSAGGMIDMNIDTFGSVIRKAFSFYAILRNVLNN